MKAHTKIMTYLLSAEFSVLRIDFVVDEFARFHVEARVQKIAIAETDVSMILNDAIIVNFAAGFCFVVRPLAIFLCEVLTKLLEILVIRPELQR
jgi:hypothetical protein